MQERTCCRAVLVCSDFLGHCCLPCSNSCSSCLGYSCVGVLCKFLQFLSSLSGHQDLCADLHEKYEVLNLEGWRFQCKRNRLIVHLHISMLVLSARTL